MTEEEAEKFAEEQEVEKININYPIMLDRIKAISGLYAQMIPVSNFWHKTYNEENSSEEVLAAVTIPVPYKVFRMFMTMGFVLTNMADDAEFKQYLEGFYVSKGEEPSE